MLKVRRKRLQYNREYISAGNDSTISNSAIHFQPNLLKAQFIAAYLVENQERSRLFSFTAVNKANISSPAHRCNDK